MTINCKKALKPVFLILTLLCMAMIFCFSMENSSESSDRSSGFTEMIVRFLNSDYESMSTAGQREVFKRTEHIVRKLAHFSIYMVLGFLCSFYAGRRKLLTFRSLAVLTACFFYACSDEIHQYFVPGRSCQMKDVLIDTSGAFTGILLSIAVFFIAEKLLGRKE